MILEFILRNKRWVLIALLSIVLLGQLAYTNHLSGKLNKADAKCSLDKQQIRDAHLAILAESQEKLNSISELYEAEKRKDKVIYNEHKREVQTIIKENPIYRECSLDERMLSKIREATTSTKP